jgi:hypothetical protein
MVKTKPSATESLAVTEYDMALRLQAAIIMDTAAQRASEKP